MRLLSLDISLIAARPDRSVRVEDEGGQIDGERAIDAVQSSMRRRHTHKTQRSGDVQDRGTQKRNAGWQEVETLCCRVALFLPKWRYMGTDAGVASSGRRCSWEWKVTSDNDEFSCVYSAIYLASSRD
jgi:hypothetical protein